jgi:hypothetical protein
LGIVLAATASAAELKVTQYDGPTECDEANNSDTWSSFTCP